MKKIIVANWKMNPQSLAETRELLKGIKKGIKPEAKKKAEVIICPPFVYLPELAKSDLTSGGQDCFWKDPPAGGGAYTGEVSPLMLKNLGVKYVILGHSERRENLGETNELVNKKVLAGLKHNLKVILCVGEKERGEYDQSPAIVKEELCQGLRKVSKQNVRNLIIAYEPIWAISPGGPDTPEDVLEMAIYIRKVLVDIFGRIPGYQIPILYGGSINSRNAEKFLKIEGISGFLVGNASLKAEEFSKIVNLC